MVTAVHGAELYLCVVAFVVVLIPTVVCGVAFVKEAWSHEYKIASVVTGVTTASPHMRPAIPLVSNRLHPQPDRSTMMHTQCPNHGDQTVTHLGPRSITVACGCVLVNGKVKQVRR